MKSAKHYSMGSGNSETVTLQWAREHVGTVVFSGYEIQQHRFLDRSGNLTFIVAIGWSEYLTNVIEITHEGDK